jgi:hypothetical protein
MASRYNVWLLFARAAQLAAQGFAELAARESLGHGADDLAPIPLHSAEPARRASTRERLRHVHPTEQQRTAVRARMREAGIPLDPDDGDDTP